MRDKMRDTELSELVVIVGVFLLLGSCIVIEAVEPESNLETILNGLVITLTAIAGHLFGKTAGIAGQKTSDLKEEDSL